MRQPAWTIDEVILGVNTYFEIGDVRRVNVNNPLVIRLSELLRSMPIHENKDQVFRNLVGVEMTLKCIASLDENSKYTPCAKLQSYLQRYINIMLTKRLN